MKKWVVDIQKTSIMRSTAQYCAKEPVKIGYTLNRQIIARQICPHSRT